MPTVPERVAAIAATARETNPGHHAIELVIHIHADGKGFVAPKGVSGKGRNIPYRGDDQLSRIVVDVVAEIRSTTGTA